MWGDRAFRKSCCPKHKDAFDSTSIRNAKPAKKSVRLFDERGLYLELAPAGGKWWRWKYRYDGKEKRLSLGVYPDVGLKDARVRRDECRKLLANGIDPSQNRKAEKASRSDRAANSFEVVTREWMGTHSASRTESHNKRLLRLFARDIFPRIGRRPIAEVTAPELLVVLRTIESRGAVDTAHRALGSCGQVFRYSIATGRAERNVAADLRGALPLTEALAVGEAAPLLAGGFGFNPTREPHMDCPECFGRGIESVIVKDTRQLSEKAAKLYAGAQQTKDGVKALGRNQNDALMALGRSVGLFKERTEVSGPDGGPVALAAVSLNTLTNAQLEAILRNKGYQLPERASNDHA